MSLSGRPLIKHTTAWCFSHENKALVKLSSASLCFNYSSAAIKVECKVNFQEKETNAFPVSYWFISVGLQLLGLLFLCVFVCLFCF